jgi:hypothetical protein
MVAVRNAGISGDSGFSRGWGAGNCVYQAGDYRLGIHALCVPRLALCRICPVDGFRRACLASTIVYRNYGAFLERISQIRISGFVGTSVLVCSLWCWSLHMLYTYLMEGFRMPRRWRNILAGAVAYEEPSCQVDAFSIMKGRLMSIRLLVVVGLGLMICSYSSADVNDYICGGLQNGYGPYDYRSDKDKLSIVEQFHLTSNVISLTSPQSAGSVGGDLDYVLRAFPNHHVALNAMFRLGDKEKLPKPRGAKYSIECYFQRALRFRNDDAIVKTVYAAYLAKHGKSKEALTQLIEAAQLGEDNANVIYNTGLIYFDLKDYEKSLSYAHQAYRLGFPLPGLRDKLKRLGKWREPAVQIEPVPSGGAPEEFSSERQ